MTTRPLLCVLSTVPMQASFYELYGDTGRATSDGGAFSRMTTSGDSTHDTSEARAARGGRAHAPVGRCTVVHAPNVSKQMLLHIIGQRDKRDRTRVNQFIHDLKSETKCIAASSAATTYFK